MSVIIEELTEYLRSELVGPKVEDEILNEPPTKQYAMGILFPKEAEVSLYNSDPTDGDTLDTSVDEVGESPVSLAYQRLPASMGVSFQVRNGAPIDLSLNAARYLPVAVVRSEFNSGGDVSVKFSMLFKDAETKRVKVVFKAEELGVEVLPVVNRIKEGFEFTLNTSTENPSTISDLIKSIDQTPDLSDVLRIKVVAGKVGSQIANSVSSGLTLVFVQNKKSLWKRLPLIEYESSCPELIGVTASGSWSLFDNNIRIDVKRRQVAEGELVTVTLINPKQSKSKFFEPGACLYQVGFKVHVQTPGDILSYANSSHGRGSDEDNDLAFIYRNRQPFGIGHGCSVTWEDDLRPSSISAEVLPIAEVHHITTSLDLDDNSNVLSLQYLADEEVAAEDLRTSLSEFVDRYEAWINSVELIPIAPQHQASVGRILDKLRSTLSRQRKGIETLCLPQNADVLLAFRIANLSMLMQLVNTNNEPGTCHELEVYQSPKCSSFKWRPFQLAFQLLSVNSIIDDSTSNSERRLVDLIWFPTGGGKTEAYLAVAALQIVWRRMKRGGRSGGTAVITRYTYRLLTAQQFERTAALVTALEYLRQTEFREELGRYPITIGNWVGQASTPNEYLKAKELYDVLIEQAVPENPFPLRACPWCNTSITPARRDVESQYGIVSTDTSFNFRCVNSKCRFSENIPVSVIDEQLYENPPTILLGTIDKFARMAWKPESRVFLGAEDEGMFHPPELIIQDELHLISGPLGTIAGLYEAAIETVISTRGSAPKIIAATATIRNAAEQVKALYGREVNIFPPMGINHDDSFYARADKSRPGRFYVGVMPQGHRHLYALVETSTALVRAPYVIGLKDMDLDTYFTQVVYHNSRKELGKTMTLVHDDINARLRSSVVPNAQERTHVSPTELSANIPGTEVHQVLNKLEKPYDSDEAVDVLPCTSMISVGVDIPRLGLMLVNGQPKTTSEYIQATSRVGRDQRRPPGLVVTMLNPGRPRDRSHYEDFSYFHQNLYRNVNPTSVTPFAPPACERAMHAALVIVVRFCTSLGENDEAGAYVDHLPLINSLVKKLEERLTQAANKDDVASIQLWLTRRAEEWKEYADEHRDKTRYNGGGNKQFRPLLKYFESPAEEIGLWKTLNSMRHVDAEIPVEVR